MVARESDELVAWFIVLLPQHKSSIYALNYFEVYCSDKTIDFELTTNLVLPNNCLKTVTKKLIFFEIYEFYSEEKGEPSVAV
jgi:hypothetical protein